MMKVKIFKVRLTEEFQAEDESLLNDFLESVKVMDVQSSVVNAPPDKFWTILVIYEEKDVAAETAVHRIMYDTSEPLTPDEEEMYLQLRSWRDTRAQKDNIPPYMILHNSHLKAVVKVQPRTKEDFLRIAGISRRKINKYADDLLQVMKLLDQQEL
jgi:ribonuclease D